MHQMRLIPVAGPAIDHIEVDAQARTLIGRSSDCTVCIKDAAISRRHALIFSTGNKWVLTDLGSKHGTSLNGIELELDKPALIEHRDLLNIGPYMFRVSTSARDVDPMTITDDSVSAGTVVEAVEVSEEESIEAKRLSLLIGGCSKIFQAPDQHALAMHVLSLVLSGTGYSRGAVLLWNGTPNEVEVLASRDHRRSLSDDGITFSRSLLQASASGDLVRMSPSSQHQYGQSIAGLGILEALCAPLVIDAMVVGSIYLDVREGEAPPERDAAQFCHVVSQVASLAISNLKHVDLVRRQEHLEEDLKIAQEAQAFLLPESQGVAGQLRYASRTLPGSVIGGDLFDIFEIDENLTGICFGDVSGHGIGAAILMTAALTHLKTMLRTSGDPAAAAVATNNYLVEHSSARMFTTLWVGVFDSRSGSLRYVDAGHGHWLICRSDAPPSAPPAPGGVLAGIRSGIAYSVEEIDFGCGDRLVLYSDGLVEQSGPGLERFESERLFEVLARSGSISQDVAMSFEALEAFAGVSSFTDDTTIASVEINPD
jgi:sigma-B regulation protein RsbU (phosphoserine phosphatase)